MNDSRGASLPAYAVVAAELRGHILSGALRPGDRLPVEPELSGRYGVSRSTVREALRLLASQNLITTTRGVTGGSFVARPQPRHISDHFETVLSLLTVDTQLTVGQLLELRELLEIPAAGLAASRRREADLAELRASLFGPAHDDDLAALRVETLYPPVRRFHAVLLRATGNPLLDVVTRPVFRVLNQRFLRERVPARAWRQIDGDHREILRHVEAGDEQGAAETARAHLANMREIYLADADADADAKPGEPVPAPDGGAAW